MPTERDKAVALLAYALFDAENTTKLGEALLEEQSSYFKRAEQILDMIKFRNKKFRVNLARHIRR
jgi:hypothetical protein